MLFRSIRMVRDGNVANIPVEVSDIKLFYKIYGEPVESIRGKTTDQNTNTRDTYDEGVKMQITNQSLTTDVMHVAGEKFMISIAEPLNLIITAHVPNLDQITLGHALQGHMDILQMFGFTTRVVRVDPARAMVCLRGRFPGIEIDVGAAGEHLPMVDVRIREIKKNARTLLQSLD